MSLSTSVEATRASVANFVIEDDDEKCDVHVDQDESYNSDDMSGDNVESKGDLRDCALWRWFSAKNPVDPTSFLHENQLYETSAIDSRTNTDSQTFL